jgi:hypothetical protein
MVKKEIQGHDFLNGGPIKQYRIDFGDGLISVHPGDITIDSNIIPTFNSRFELNDSNGDNIFLVNEDRVSWMGQNLVTEERVLELIRRRFNYNSIH